MNRARWLAAVVLALCCGLAGCTTLPDQGAVFTRPDSSADLANEAPYFAPPGPVPGAARDDVVRGFLLAMQANPPSTAVAREFLSKSARESWKPVQGTIVYDASIVEATTDQIYARFNDAHRLDPRGTWVGGADPVSTTIPFSLVSEQGQWRIDNPPNELAVPASYFSSLFAPFVLYFFDHTGTVLVPTRVYLPRGEQTATNLVRGLLAGPSGAAGEASSSAFGPRTGLDLGVVVNDAGVAVVPLSPDVLRLAPEDLRRAVVQLAWTLRQVPGITRLRITVDGTAVPLIDGQTDVSVTEGAAYDPTAAAASEPLALLGDQVVRITDTGAIAVGGPFGRPGFALRSIAVATVRHEVAAVAATGQRLYLASDRGPVGPESASSVIVGATNLLRPAFDRFGGLWTIDVGSRGAVVHLVSGGNDRVVDVPGLSGRRITSFTVSRDGSRLIAGLASRSPTLLVSWLDRSAAGRVDRAQTAVPVLVPGPDIGEVLDVGQGSATTAVVLTQPVIGSGRIVTVELDGSPGGPGVSIPEPVPGRMQSLLASPDPGLWIQVVTADGRLLWQTDAGSWVRRLSGVIAAAYPQ